MNREMSPEKEKAFLAACDKLQELIFDAVNSGAIEDEADYDAILFGGSLALEFE